MTANKFFYKNSKNILTKEFFCDMIFKSRNDMEMSPSWSRAHDCNWCNRQKRFESSNLSFSANKKSRAYTRDFFVFLNKKLPVIYAHSTFKIVCSSHANNAF